VKWYRFVKKVLFVCVENTNRSQMVEAIFNKLAMGQDIAVSAGDKPTLKVDPKAGEVMNEIGIDTTEQRLQFSEVRNDIRNRVEKLIKALEG